MKIYAELFLVLFAIFSLITVIFYLVGFGLSGELLRWIWDDLLLAAVLAFLLTVLQIATVKRLPFKKDTSAFNFAHARSLELALSYNEIMKLCIASLGGIHGTRMREVSYAHGRIIAIVPSTWRYLSQVIAFDVQELGASVCAVKVSSSPAVSAVRVDFGKNLENIEKIVAFLKASIVRA